MARSPGQVTIFDVIKRTLEPSEIIISAPSALEVLAPWLLCPAWPPDVFAVAATLLELSGCYTQASSVGGSACEHDSYICEVMDAACAWRDDITQAPDVVHEWWTRLLESRDISIAELHADPNSHFDLVAILLRLFAAADEACIGIGWSNISQPKSGAAEVCLTAFALGISPVQDLPYVRHSLCIRVSPYTCTVLPKALTAPVGCTLRSLSHHLALLPSIAFLKAKWLLADNDPGTGIGTGKPVRLLILPFPYRVDAESFVPGARFTSLSHAAKMQPYFSIRQTWLTHEGLQITARQLLDELVIPLLTLAVGKSFENVVDGILLPECALSVELAEELGKLLALEADKFGLKFFICGAMNGGTRENLAMNWVFGARDDGGVPFTKGSQAKQHRWALDDSQINRYGITALADSSATKWWEDIDVSRRKLPFFAVRDDLCMTVLICEDLARADPAMDIVRSVGPNLVVALLMDGPQLAQRWSGRYATILAEDPGSSVLSITCAGMVDRSNLLERNPVRAVGLWRHENGPMQELYLPSGHHAVLIALDSVPEEQFTLDHRTDGKSTNRLKLRTIKPLALETVPKWL